MHRVDRDLLLAVALVAGFTGWNAAAELLHRQLALGTLPPAAPLRLALHLLGASVTLLGIVWLGCVRFGLGSLRALGWSLQGRPMRVLALAVLQTAAFAALAFAAAATLLGGRRGVELLASAATTMPAAERTYYLLLGSQVAIAEESLFRGLLLQALAKKWGVLAAVVLSSVLFALFHRLTAPPFLLLKFVFGVLSAASVVACRSLVPATIAHAALWALFGDT